MITQNPQSFSGVYALMLTPFNDDKTVDYQAYEAYAEWQAANRPDHIFAVCGTSEMAVLTLPEREKLASLTVSRAGGIPVFATGNLEPSWFAQVEEVKRMSATGVSGLVFVTKGMGDDPERQFAYLCELAEHTELPIVLYECPTFRPHKMEASVYGRLVQTGRFFGIKDTTCTLPAIKEKIDVQGDSSVLQANIPLLFESYKLGARGVMATTTCCGARLFQKMWDEFSRGDLAAAEKTFRLVVLLDTAIDNGFTSSAKYLLDLLGVKMNWIKRDGSVNLSISRMQALKVYSEWAVANNAI
ncbi:MAG: dihydrodipicolinate synthase family protein [Oscillospiraceae bacterium]|nr:dihydrodipicolinate synthase family protein [Oscillospiraceae bacterium]